MARGEDWGGRVTVAVRGIQLAVHGRGDYVSDEIRRTRDFHEAEILDEIRRRVSGGVLIDAGAMIGNHTAYLAAFVPHSAIHAFEPWPGNAELLRANVARYPTVIVHEQALSDQPAKLRMRSEANRGHSMVDGDGPVEVDAVTLDSFGFTGVALLKIDVELHEPQLLAGALDTMARCRPLVVIEDWSRQYGTLLPGYQLAAQWPRRQTYMYEWAG